MINRWKDKDYREFHRLKLVRMWQDEDYRKTQSLRMKDISRNLWENENHRKLISEKMRKYCSNEEVKKETEEVTDYLEYACLKRGIKLWQKGQ